MAANDAVASGQHQAAGAWASFACVCGCSTTRGCRGDLLLVVVLLYLCNLQCSIGSTAAKLDHIVDHVHDLEAQAFWDRVDWSRRGGSTDALHCSGQVCAQRSSLNLILDDEVDGLHVQLQFGGWSRS